MNIKKSIGYIVPIYIKTHIFQLSMYIFIGPILFYKANTVSLSLLLIKRHENLGLGTI